jgi:hypothetical protein
MKKIKVKKLKSKTKINESPIVNSKKSLGKKENSIQDEVLDKNAISIVKIITENVVKIVVNKLKPDIELAVNNRFDDIKKIVTSEVQDIRTTIENKLPSQQLEQIQVGNDVAHSPDGKVRGLENSTMRNPTKQGSNPMESLLPMLMQLIPSILGKSGQEVQGDNMPKMLVELMMKKFVNDMGRSDTQNQAVTDYLLKQMVKRDPSILKGLSNLDVTKSPDKEEHY